MALNMTGVEFEAYMDSGNRYVSDLDYGFNHITGQWDRPAVEWESCYGSHWAYYVTEASRTEHLDNNEREMAVWLEEYRAKQAKIEADKKAEKQRIANLKTLGGQFPQLEKLLKKVA